MNVVTKSGSDRFHGDAFEFLRNTDLDARNYFDHARGAFRQNQFGGTLGGPIRKSKVFFFSDYQGTRTWKGSFPPAMSRAIPRSLSDVASYPDRHGERTRIAILLTQRAGLRVTQGEPYYTAGAATAANA